MYILGLNSVYHESSACLLKDGVILAAVEEERFTRRKHGKASAIDNPHYLPTCSIDYCLNVAGITPAQVEHIGFSLKPDERLKNKDFRDRTTKDSWGTPEGEERFFKNLGKIPEKMREMGFDGKFSWIDHHLCHSASSFYLSPFTESAVLTVDGIGETNSTQFAYGKGDQLTVLQTIEYPASLGFLWEKMSKYLGFTEYDAYKVMGLAAYGDSTQYIDHFRSIVAPSPSGHFTVDNDVLCFRIENYSALENLFGFPRRERAKPLTAQHQNIAAALQKITDEIMLHLVNSLYEQTHCSALCMAGGVALNCITNAFIHEKGPFSHLYIQPAAHDAGTALGAALIIWNGLMGAEHKQVLNHVYLGPSFNGTEIASLLEDEQLPYRRVRNIERVVAELLSQGNVVGWFQGAMEFGPRALGNRSLLADPRNPNIKEIMNVKVKHREQFRPFAPSVLAEAAHDWFTIHKTTPASDFMLLGYAVKEEVKDKIPAIVHVDGTSRIQTVHRETNQKYHRLISEFFQLTSIPLLLNTSFNDSEPIVCTPQDAIRTFLNTEMDYLALGDCLLDGREVRNTDENTSHHPKKSLVAANMS